MGVGGGVVGFFEFRVEGGVFAGEVVGVFGVLEREILGEGFRDFRGRLVGEVGEDVFLFCGVCVVDLGVFGECGGLFEVDGGHVHFFFGVWEVVVLMLADGWLVVEVAFEGDFFDVFLLLVVGRNEFFEFYEVHIVESASGCFVVLKMNSVCGVLSNQHHIPLLIKLLCSVRMIF